MSRQLEQVRIGPHRVLDVEPRTLVVGNPARVLRAVLEEELLDR